MIAAGPAGAGPAAWRTMAESADLVDGLYLVRNSVPFDVAFSLDRDERTAWIVALGTLDGRVWDWGAMRWTT